MRRMIVLASGVAVLSMLVGCSDESPAADEPTSTPAQTSESTPSPSTEQPSETASGEPTTVPEPRVAGTVATGFTSPWGLAFLPDGSALVSERDTALVKRIATDGDVSELGEVPDVEPSGEGGLLGIAVAPTFDDDRLVYAYFTAGGDNRIVRMRYEGSSLGDPEVVLDGIPNAFVHNGGRITFGPDGHLYVGTGDATDGENSQDEDSLGGKILRITPDGDPAPGNPDGSRFVSLGHRNVQGLAFDPDNRLWAAEFGQNTWDEVNLIRPGDNYGWPQHEGATGAEGFVDPLAQWRTDEASPSGLAYADGALWLAGLRGERLWRIQVRDGRVVGDPQAFFEGEYGRLRTVAQAPDGSLWLVTSNTDGRGDPRDGDDRILRIELTR